MEIFGVIVALVCVCLSIYMAVAAERSCDHMNAVYRLRHELIDYWADATVFTVSQRMRRLRWYDSLPRPESLIAKHPWRWNNPDPKSQVVGEFAAEFWRWKAAKECKRLDEAEISA